MFKRPAKAGHLLAKVLGCEVETLPTLPVIAAQIIQLASDETSSADDLAKVISRDPSLSSQLLKLANSPVFGFVGRVESLARAVALLGYDEIRDLALGVLIFQSAGGSDRRSRHRTELWSHSVIVGLLSEILAKEELRLGSGYYVYGLIHDLGKVILDAFLPERFEEILDLVDRERISFSEAEKRTVGLDHARLGQALLIHWKLPASVSTVIGCHHTPWEAKGFQDAAGAVFLADKLARELGYFPFAPRIEEDTSHFYQLRATMFPAEREWNLDERLLDRLRERLQVMAGEFDHLVE
jgi:HD-like signal output (HDOD) protein